MGSVSNTIVALLTGEISLRRQILRLSGAEVPAIVGELLGKEIDEWKWSVREEFLKVKISDTLPEAPLNVFLLTMPEGCSYTREHVAELHYPANPLITRELLGALYKLGARPAEPGEFTRRACMNGRLSLNQAVGVAELISGSDEARRREALKRMSGEVGGVALSLRNELLELRALMESQIDFPEEEGVTAGRGEIFERCQKIEGRICVEREKIRGQGGGNEQLHILVAGAANAGKSSLLAKLIPGEQPLVSEMAGTTLDLVPYAIEVEGRKVVLYDSPGLREGAQELESWAQNRLFLESGRFDACIFLQATDQLEVVNPPQLNGPICFVKSKSDLRDGSRVPDEDLCWLSAKTGEGISELQKQILRWVRDLRKPTSPWNVLELRLLEMLEGNMEEIRQLCSDESYELAAPVIDDLLEELDEMLYSSSGAEEMMELIFSSFCIGK